MNAAHLEDILALAYTLMSHEDKPVRDLAIYVSILVNALLERSH